MVVFAIVLVVVVVSPIKEIHMNNLSPHKHGIQHLTGNNDKV